MDTRLAKLSAIGRELASLHTEEEICRTAVEGVIDILSCRRVVLIVRRGDDLRVVDTRGIDAPALAVDAELEAEKISDLLREHLAPTFVGVPLVAHEEVVGLLAIDGAPQLDPREVTWHLSAVGDQLALALFHCPDELIEELEHELRESQGQARLRRLALDGLTHDIRSPLNAIHLNLELLDSSALGPLTDAQRSTIASMLRSAKLASSLVNQMLELGRLDSSREPFRESTVHAREIVEECVENRRTEIAARDQTIDLTGLAPVG
ncbi:MAG: hypothetical protein KDC38_20605, partial [Planctomycetes bacterium]|nr:hypothetical protein [Planctomycetota bacterium]